MEGGVVCGTGGTKRLWLSATMSEQLGSVMKYVSIGRASSSSSSAHLYTAFGRNAPHRTTQCDMGEFVSDKCGSNPWVRIPGFHPSMVIYDWLHVLDLALIPDAAASVAWIASTTNLCATNGLISRILGPNYQWIN